MESPIKVFLDSNVLFSIAYTGKDRSRSYLIYEIQALGKVKVFLSSLVCEESLFNIRRKKPEAEGLMKELIRKSKVLRDVAADLKHPGTSQLPCNDRVILSTAVYHKMDVFVTGNDRDFGHICRKSVLGTLILRPVDFLNMNF